jgi:hypothetical protein
LDHLHQSTSLWFRRCHGTPHAGPRRTVSHSYLDQVNEFHTLQGSCAGLVPQGPGYEGVSLDNQVCASVGAVAGQNTVDGNRFVSLSYGYTHSELWQVRFVNSIIHSPQT